MPAGRAPRCRRSCSTCSTGIASSSRFRQTDLFAQATVCDYLFDKDKIFAYLNLDDNELFIYQRLYDLLAKDVAAPDLVVYLQAPTDTLARRLRERPRDDEPRLPDAERRLPARAERGLSALLLPLHGHAAAGRRHVARRLRRQRPGPRRSDPTDQDDGTRHDVLRAANVTARTPERTPDRLIGRNWDPAGSPGAYPPERSLTAGPC